MRDRINIVKIDNRPPATKDESDCLRDGRDSFDRQLRAVLDQRRRDWELGFVAALDLMAQREAEPKLARGTRDVEDMDTAPYPIIDPDIIMVE